MANEDYIKIGNHRIIDGKHCFKFDWSENGYIFQDEEAYLLRPDDICYVPEYAIEDFEGGELGGEKWDMIVKVGEAEGVQIFSHNDLLEECEEFVEQNFDSEDADWIAEELGITSISDWCDRVFYSVSWQFPSTYLEECLNYT